MKPLQRGMPIRRFHESHGLNIELQEGGVVAKRMASFANAITFSEKPLKQGEVFLIEIEDHEKGWSGHLRCGLTQHQPSQMTQNRDPLFNTNLLRIPQYSMPDLANMGKSWIFAITKYHNRVPSVGRDAAEGTSPASSPKPFIEGFGNYVRCGGANLPKHKLVGRDKEGGELLATCIGSRIGITYEIVDGAVEMHFIINGDDQGGAIMDQADLDQPFYAMVDVYGTTKQVKIIQLDLVITLQECCRDVIRELVSERGVDGLPLPTKLKEYLKFEVP
ncbi:neuralized-like protein 2 [Ptychodera flava]|uniref:neuralized-like protein 2 n=1 Tax=Ptychodera flava TaxID=63121 RepID=UPI00396A1F89